MGDNKKEIENKEIHDSFGERFKALLSSFKRDDLTNVDIYNKIYGNKNIDDSSKKNKISNLRNGKTVTLDDLIAISHTFDISLDWLVFGKEESPAQNEAKKTALDKAEESNNFFTDYEYISLLQSYEETEDKEETALVESLLDNERPVLQMFASFLHLLSYANISLIGDYDINNMDMPQSLTIKITPKSFWKYGYFDENNQKFIFTYKSRNPRLLIWDFRATLLQRFIALALDQQKKLCFAEKTLLKSLIWYMNSDLDRPSTSCSYSEFALSSNTAAPKVINPVSGLSHYSIIDVLNKCTIINAYPFNSFDFTDYNIPALNDFTAHCDADKVPGNVIESGDTF